MTREGRWAVGPAVGLILWLLSSPSVAQTAVSAADAAHIRAIESGILPSAVTRGVPPRTSSLADRMKATRTPGVSIAVFRDGKIAWARAYGVADANGRPVTPDTLFQAASISKPVSATAVLSLVQAGRLNLDTDVNAYLKSWKLPPSDFTNDKPVTLRGVLSHTAGLTVHGFPGYAQGATLPTLAQVLDGEKPANTAAVRVDTRPGANWRYSGGGYVLVQQLVEDVTGKPFAAVVREAVLVPAGMTRSTFDQPLPLARTAEAASPHDSSGGPYKEGAHVYPEAAAAGLWTTPSDLARYAIAMQGALAGASPVLGKDLARQMLTPGGLGGWGLGWQVGGEGDRLHFEHGGANAGFQSNLVAYAGGDGVAVMTNSDNGGQLIVEILRTVAQEYGWPDYGPVERVRAPLDPAVADNIVGHYQVGRYAFFAVTRQGDKLVVTGDGPTPRDLLPASDGEWFYGDANVRVSVDGAQAGPASKLTLRTGGSEVIALRVGEAEAARGAAELAAKLATRSPDPRAPAMVRRLLEAQARRRPDYESMSASLAAVVRRQPQGIANYLAKAGPIRSTTFKGVGPSGGDIYEVLFEGGERLEARIIVSAAGLAEAFTLRELPPS